MGVVDDHEAICVALERLLTGEPNLQYAGWATTVPRLLAQHPRLELVVLDLRLADGSGPAQNVAAIHGTGASVLVFTTGNEPFLVREAARAGVLGVVRKSEPLASFGTALREAAAGKSVPTADWAAALDGDPGLADAGLSQRERDVLALYASGEKGQRVAHRLGTSPATVKEHIDRVRTKYAQVGRAAPTKVDLYRRAVEDGLLPTPGLVPFAHDARG